VLQLAAAQLVLFDVGRGAGPARIAGVLAATLVPFTLVGPFAGTVVDRFDRRRVLLSCSVARTVVTLLGVLVVAAAWTPGAYALVMTVVGLSRLAAAARSAAIPRLVPDDRLVTGNAVASLAGTIAATLGVGVGSAVVGVGSAATGVATAAGLYAASGAIFWGLRGVGGGEASGERLGAGLARVARETAAGVRAALTDAAVRTPLVSVWTHRWLLGAGFVVLVLLADTRFGLEAPGYGLAVLVVGSAAVGGSALVPAWARRAAPPRLAAAAFLAAATFSLLGAAVVARGSGSALLVGTVACVGGVAAAFQVLKLTVDAAVQRGTGDAVRGRVFVVYDIGYNLAFVLAGLALAPVWRPGTEAWLLAAVAAGFAGGAVVAGRAWRRL
jgi:hypothetical protein